MSKVTALIDGDIVAYNAASRHQKAFKWPGLDEPSISVGSLGDAVTDAVEATYEQAEKVGATDIIFCMSCPSAEGWRKAIYPAYKSNRGAKPVLLPEVKQAMREKFDCYERPTLEADDIMGILSTHPTLVKGKKVIVSIDKDMRTIPGWLFNPAKDRKPRLIDPEEAAYWHLYQTLIGDSTDGYPGCPGVGPKKAEKVLGFPANQVCPDPASRWALVVNTYASKGLTEEDALLQARVARICRHTDYDFNTKEVILWTPPSSGSSRPRSAASTA